MYVEDFFLYKEYKCVCWIIFFLTRLTNVSSYFRFVKLYKLNSKHIWKNVYQYGSVHYIHAILSGMSEVLVLQFFNGIFWGHYFWSKSFMQHIHRLKMEYWLYFIKRIFFSFMEMPLKTWNSDSNIIYYIIHYKSCISWV